MIVFEFVGSVFIETLSLLLCFSWFWLPWVCGAVSVDELPEPLRFSFCSLSLVCVVASRRKNLPWVCGVVFCWWTVWVCGVSLYRNFFFTLMFLLVLITLSLWGSIRRWITRTISIFDYFSFLFLILWLSWVCGVVLLTMLSSVGFLFSHDAAIIGKELAKTKPPPY